jgi:hypothetical protein
LWYTGREGFIHKKGKNMEINTSELAEFLEVTRKKDLATWERQRNSWELDSFVSRRLAALDGVQSEELELI